MDYLEIDKLIELNLLALIVIRAKKADSSKVLSRTKLEVVLKDCKACEGDVFDKATVLLKGIVKAHAFESGNRRTAFLAMKYFLFINNSRTRIVDDPANSRVMLGIRENFYSDEEIKEWVKNGKIREFERKI